MNTTTPYDPFETFGRGPRKRRSPLDPGMVQVTEDIICEALPSLCSDSVVMAEVGAASMCIGYYVDRIFGSDAREFGDTAPEPALRILETFGPRTSVRPFALAVCAGALVRLTSSPEAHEIAQRIIERHGAKRGYMDVWPAWRELPLVVPERAWVSRHDDGRTQMLVTSWRDASGIEHTFATSGYDNELLGDEVGDAINAIILGESPEELLEMMAAPIDELPGMDIESITLGEAHELLARGIDDVPLAAKRMLPRDLPLTSLAFLEHRRDLLA